MFKSVWGYTLFAILTLSGCGSDSDVLSDLDDDGTVDTLDCAPQNDAKWQLKSYLSEDADLDGKFAEAQGEVCVGEQLPAKYAASEVITADIDCDDNNDQVWVLRTYNSLDKDFDSKYGLISGEVCSGEALPANYLANAVPEDKLDCNDDDKSIWRSSITFIDSDKDGFGTGEQQNTCYGSVLPISQALVSGDCDDSNPQAWTVRTYQAQDNDSDGVFVAAEGGLCAGNSLPFGFLESLPNEPTDCDDNNSAMFLSLNYAASDMDLDGFQVNANGTECTGGSLSSIYQSTFDSSKAPDCNDSNIQQWRSVGAFEDTDGDGFGAGNESSYCIGEHLPNNVSINSSDCDDYNSAVFVSLNYQAADLDLDSFQIQATGSECTGGSLSEKFKATFDSSKLADCDDTNNQAWRSVVAYGDADSDSYGTGAGESYCIGAKLPSNLSVNSTDCDDANSAVFENLNYSAIDEDLDSYQLSLAGTECTNGTLPEIYQVIFDGSKLPDCNDANDQAWRIVMAFSDTDADGYGAGSETQHCIGDSLPPLWVDNSTDCEDTNANIWREELIYADADADGYGSESTTALTCIGEQPPVGQVFDSSDCDDTNNNAWRIDQAYFDIDGDGIGAGSKLEHCTNDQAAVNTSQLSYDCDDNDISVFRNILIYPDTDGDGIGAGQGSVTCMGNSYLEGNVSIYGYDPEPDNAEISNFDLPMYLLATPQFQFKYFKRLFSINYMRDEK